MIPVGLCYLTELQFAPSLLGAPLLTVLHLPETEGEQATETDMEVVDDPSQIPDVLTQVSFQQRNLELDIFIFSSHFLQKKGKNLIKSWK